MGALNMIVILHPHPALSLKGEGNFSYFLSRAGIDSTIRPFDPATFYFPFLSLWGED
jgi:hypothetical protein